MKSFSFLVIVLVLSSLSAGCVTRGKAKEAHVSFGIAPIFRVEKDLTGGSITEAGGVKEATGSTHVQILNFEFKSSTKDMEVKFERNK